MANAVPEHAWCIVDVRFRTMAGLARVEKGFEEIAKKTYIDHTTTKYERTVLVPAMERIEGSEKLFERANEEAQKAGLPAMKAIAVGGGSDSAYLTMAGIPTLCAMGVKGEFNHTVREWAEESSLTEREKLLLTCLVTL